MGDSIFDIGDDDLAAAGLSGTADDKTVTLTAEQFQAMQNEQEQMRTSMANMSAKLEQATALLEAKNTPEPPKNPSADPLELSPDEALREFATNPSEFAAKVADGRITKAVAEQLAPLLTPIIQTTHQNILGSERAAFDAKFGVGKFDEIILPDLQSDIDRLSQQGSQGLGDAGVVKALVERTMGQKREELNKAESEVAESREKAEQEDVARVVAALPPGMQPKPTGGVKELPDEANALFDEIERATGERPDQDTFLAVHNAKPGNDGFLEAMKTLEGDA